MSAMPKQVPTKRREPTDADRLAIVEHLLAGKTINQTAEIVQLDRFAVEAVASRCGWPTKPYLEMSADRLRQALAPTPAEPTPEPAPEPVATEKPAVPAQPAPAGPDAAILNATRRVTSLQALIDAGRKSEREHTRHLADRLARLAADLRSRVDEETGQRAEKKGAAMRARHAEQRALLDRHGVTIADVRAWAAANGIEPGNTSLLARGVADAYTAAHPEAG